MKIAPLLALLLAAACSGNEPPPSSFEAELLHRFDASEVEVFTVTPPLHLEVVLRADAFADADQARLIETTREVALFVAARLSSDSGVEMIAVELITEDHQLGPVFSRRAIRGEHPLSSL